MDFDWLLDCGWQAAFGFSSLRGFVVLVVGWVVGVLVLSILCGLLVSGGFGCWGVWFGVAILVG